MLVLKKRKNILNFAFIAIIFLVTVYSIFKGKDIEEIYTKIMQVSPWCVVLCVISIFVYIYMESHIIHYMLASLGIFSKRTTCFLYSGIGFFFSLITPGAAGGQPAQIYFMKKDRISVPVSTVILMIVTITFKLVLVVTGIFLLLFQRGFVHKYLDGVLPVFYLGLFLNTICVVFMVLLTFNQKMAKNIIITLIKILEKLRLLKYNEKREKQIVCSMDSYHNTARYLNEHRFVIIKVFLITMLQRFLLFGITYFIYRGLGLYGAGIYTIIMLQASIFISVDMLPLPGGMGLSEGLFLSIFKDVFPTGYLLPGMILSRGIGFYTQLLLCALLTCIAYVRVKSWRNKSKEKDIYIDKY